MAYSILDDPRWVYDDPYDMHDLDVHDFDFLPEEDEIEEERDRAHRDAEYWSMVS